jgi:hypothetical protein
VWPVFFPDEADSKLIVYPNAVLSRSITFKCFQAIAGRLQKVDQRLCVLQMIELPQSNDSYVRKVAVLPAKKQLLRSSAFEGPNHFSIALSQA